MSVATSEELGTEETDENVTVLVWKCEPVSGVGSTIENARITSLRNACMYGDLAAAQRLISEGADPTVKGQSGHTCLHIAALHGQVHVLEYLLVKRKTEPNVFDNSGASPLHWACYSGNMRMISMLIDCGASANVDDSNGSQPLILTAIYAHLPAMLALLKAGANVHAVDHSGRTALIMAAARGNLEEARLLLLHGSDPLHVDDSGFDCMEHARMGKHHDVLKMLKNSLLVGKTTVCQAIKNADFVRSASQVDLRMKPSKQEHLDGCSDTWSEHQSELYMLLNREVVGDLFQRLMNFKVKLDANVQAPVVQPPRLHQHPRTRKKCLRRLRSCSLRVPENCHPSVDRHS